MAIKTVDNATVKVKYKTALGEEIVEDHKVKYFQFEGLADAEHYISLGGDEKTRELRRKEVVQGINYAFSQAARAAVRTEVLKAMVGPDKAINKMVEQFMEAREKAHAKNPKVKLVTEEQARKIVLAMWEAQNATDEPEDETAPEEETAEATA